MFVFPKIGRRNEIAVRALAIALAAKSEEKARELHRIKNPLS